MFFEPKTYILIGHIQLGSSAVQKITARPTILIQWFKILYYQIDHVVTTKQVLSSHQPPVIKDLHRHT